MKRREEGSRLTRVPQRTKTTARSGVPQKWHHYEKYGVSHNRHPNMREKKTLKWTTKKHGEMCLGVVHKWMMINPQEWMPPRTQKQPQRKNKDANNIKKDAMSSGYVRLEVWVPPRRQPNEWRPARSAVLHHEVICSTSYNNFEITIVANDKWTTNILNNSTRIRSLLPETQTL